MKNCKKKKERKRKEYNRTNLAILYHVDVKRPTDGRTMRTALIAPIDCMAVTLMQCSNHSCN